LRKQIETLAKEKTDLTHDRDVKLSELTKQLKAAQAEIEAKVTELATTKQELEKISSHAAASESSGASAVKDLEKKHKEQLEKVEAEARADKQKLVRRFFNCPYVSLTLFSFLSRSKNWTHFKLSVRAMNRRLNN